jgi:hypothetical protein
MLIPVAHMPFCRVIAIAAVAVSLFGCGPGGPRRYHVSGKVSFAGAPVPAGQIHFDPDVSKGNDGPAGFAFIKDGEFDTRLDGRATIGGPHHVRIQAFDGKPGVELPLGRMMAPEYATHVELPKDNATHDFEVPAK